MFVVPMCSLHMSYLCVCMCDVISELTLRSRDHLRLDSDVVSVLYFVSYVFWE